MFKRLLAWWRERKALYKELEQLRGGPFPDFMSKEMLQHSIKLEKDWRQYIEDNAKTPAQREMLLRLAGRHD